MRNFGLFGKLAREMRFVAFAKNSGNKSSRRRGPSRLAVLQTVAFRTGDVVHAAARCIVHRRCARRRLSWLEGFCVVRSLTSPLASGVLRARNAASVKVR
jgi:hypothetical protein